MKASDYKKLKLDLFARTQDVRKFDKETGNFYKSIVIMSKRADQIASELKQEFQENSHLGNPQDRSAEEVYENREQIELSRMFEQLPKPTILALNEFENGQVYFKDPDSE